MPRPAQLPLIDWRAVFASGREYQPWLAEAESPEQREKLVAQHQAINLEPEVVDRLAALPRAVHVVAIAEDWCGDVVRHVPLLARMAELQPRLQVRYLSRADHPDVFVRFLTNGGEAIPKFIFLSESFVECGNWGPMPGSCRELIARGKACGDVAAARKLVAARYGLDARLLEAASELVHLAELAACTEP